MRGRFEQSPIARGKVATLQVTNSTAWSPHETLKGNTRLQAEAGRHHPTSSSALQLVQFLERVGQLLWWSLKDLLRFGG